MREGDDDEQRDKIKKNHMDQNNALEQAVLWIVAMQDKDAHVEHVHIAVQAVKISEGAVKKTYEKMVKLMNV